jgi:hypothetical protein
MGCLWDASAVRACARSRTLSKVAGRAHELSLGDIVEFPNWVSLAVIIVTLALAIGASLKWPGPARIEASRTL